MWMLNQKFIIRVRVCAFTHPILLDIKAPPLAGVGGITPQASPCLRSKPPPAERAPVPVVNMYFNL